MTFDLPLEKTREMVLVEGQLTLLSGVNIRFGGFHYLLSCMGSIDTIMTGNGTDASIAYMHVHSSFLNETIICKEQCCSHDTYMMNGRACAKGTRAYLLSEKALATLLLESSTVDDSL